ncbi:uncharacterized protein CPUR_03798 [Claviceps purpurea 20.1]|uniref:Uncharacterized protein n=1 Tax=Claviceps purpurea (strain 20.1) TaxID=1111077 RepID=M1W0S3_CLAP2|nr:hypothetical protein E4U38_002816 [Claviceps purpurea]KAG6221129.1 hypothetical protein E4U26_006162 [Claviceps purpurea]KAG6221373.1 hypothetical protein E4U34_002095 [Claviceps purpurea]CCE29951.1 uncharacterized protein CPUR_03798 [Claviceps purpurea 20.1]
MASPTSAMAGAFPLVESSSMEYTTTEEKVVYWPGAPRLGELVADDLAVPASQFLLGCGYVPFPGPALEEPNIVVVYFFPGSGNSFSAMQNGHIEAMVKHTNRITKHSEMCCQDLHERVRVLTEKLATGDGREADRFQLLKEQFTQNVEDLKRVESERNRLHQENQDLRESSRSRGSPHLEEEDRANPPKYRILSDWITACLRNTRHEKGI